jgi:hypothetical protein
MSVIRGHMDLPYILFPKTGNTNKMGAPNFKAGAPLA